GEPHPHPAPQRLGVQERLRQGLRREELPHRCRREWTLLPCPTHCRVLSFHDDNHFTAVFAGFHGAVCFVNLAEREDTRRGCLESSRGHLGCDVLKRNVRQREARSAEDEAAEE